MRVLKQRQGSNPEAKRTQVVTAAPAIRPFAQLDSPPCFGGKFSCQCCQCLCPNPPKPQRV
jgi:hypothetical protein